MIEREMLFALDYNKQRPVVGEQGSKLLEFFIAATLFGLIGTAAVMAAEGGLFGNEAMQLMQDIHTGVDIALWLQDPDMNCSAVDCLHNVAKLPQPSISHFDVGQAVNRLVAPLNELGQ